MKIIYNILYSIFIVISKKDLIFKGLYIKYFSNNEENFQLFSLINLFQCKNQWMKITYNLLEWILKKILKIRDYVILNVSYLLKIFIKVKRYIYFVLLKMHYCVIMRMNEESYLTIIKKDRDLKKDWKISMVVKVIYVPRFYKLNLNTGNFHII